jgi:hypothetical protein
MHCEKGRLIEMRNLQAKHSREKKVVVFQEIDINEG